MHFKKSVLLFGKKKDPDILSLMVTFDSHFADDYEMVKSLMTSGMEVARINCAHDDEVVWLKMINNIKKASHETGLSCRIYMDLAGPKIRTKLLGKGKDKGKVKEGQLIWMADTGAGFSKEEVVISPNEKGINFPDTILDIHSLTDFDKACLPFIAQNADLVGYSFVRKASDIRELRQSFEDISAKTPGLLIKIEKGTHTIKVLNTLKDILKRTSSHRAKKRFTFRSLKIAERFFESN